MSSESAINRVGYLRESFHYFHLRDTAGQELDFHFHEFDKLVILLAGSVDYLVEEQRYALPPWSVLLVRHHAIHKAIIDRSLPYERIILYLARQYFERAFPGAGLMDCFDQADRHRRHLLTATEDQLSELRAAIDAYERAADDTRIGAQTMRKTFAWRYYKETGDIYYLQNLLNHASPSITYRYIGEKPNVEIVLRKMTAEENERSRYMLLNENGGKNRIDAICDMLHALEKELSNPGNNDAFYGKADCFIGEIEELVKNYETSS